MRMEVLATDVVDEEVGHDHSGGRAQGDESEARAHSFLLAHEVAEDGLEDGGTQRGHLAEDVAEVPGGEAEHHHAALNGLDISDPCRLRLRGTVQLQLRDHLALLGGRVHVGLTNDNNSCTTPQISSPPRPRPPSQRAPGRRERGGKRREIGEGVWGGGSGS